MNDLDEFLLFVGILYSVSVNVSVLLENARQTLSVLPSVGEELTELTLTGISQKQNQNWP